MSASNERLKAELAEMRKTIESLTSPNVEQIICTEEEYDQLPPSSDDNRLRIIRIILKERPRTEPRTFSFGCEMDSQGIFPMDAQPGDKYIDQEGIEYEITAN